MASDIRRNVITAISLYLLILGKNFEVSFLWTVKK